MKKSYRIFRLEGFPSVKKYAVVRKENDAKEMNRFSGTCAGYASCRRIAQPDPMISPGRILPQDLTMPLFERDNRENGMKHAANGKMPYCQSGFKRDPDGVN